MQIKKIETLITSPGPNYLVVKIITNDGIIGYGDACLDGRTLAVKSVIDDYLSDWLQGYDVDRIEDIWQMVYRGTYWRGGPVILGALAGIDMALWDIKAKRANLPLYSLLGGKSRDKVRVYHHVHGQTDEKLIDRCHKKIEEGITYLRYSFDTEDPFKKDVFFKQPHQDVELGRIEVTDAKNEGQWDSAAYAEDLIRVTRMLREKLPPEISILHDVHGRLSGVEAARVAKELEKYNLFFLEDPVDHMNKKALKHIKNNSIIPVAIGELYNTIYDCSELIVNQLVDYIRVDISHFGGITPLVKLARLAEVYGVKTAFHGPSDISPLAHAAMLHVDMTVPNLGIQESVNFNKQIMDIFDTGYYLEEGYLKIKDRPGLGVIVNEDEAKNYPYQRKYMPILRDKMGALHNW